MKLKVFCNVCKKHIYNLLREIKNYDICAAEDFEGANETITNPSNNEVMQCPYCNNPFTVYYNEGLHLLTEEGIKP